MHFALVLILLPHTRSNHLITYTHYYTIHTILTSRPTDHSFYPCSIHQRRALCQRREGVRSLRMVSGGQLGAGEVRASYLPDCPCTIARPVSRDAGQHAWLRSPHSQSWRHGQSTTVAVTARNRRLTSCRRGGTLACLRAVDEGREEKPTGARGSRVPTWRHSGRCFVLKEKIVSGQVLYSFSFMTSIIQLIVAFIHLVLMHSSCICLRTSYLYTYSR